MNKIDINPKHKPELPGIILAAVGKDLCQNIFNYDPGQKVDAKQIKSRLDDISDLPEDIRNIYLSGLFWDMCGDKNMAEVTHEIYTHGLLDLLVITINSIKKIGALNTGQTLESIIESLSKAEKESINKEKFFSLIDQTAIAEKPVELFEKLVEFITTTLRKLIPPESNPGFRADQAGMNEFSKEIRNIYNKPVASCIYCEKYDFYIWDRFFEVIIRQEKYWLLAILFESGLDGNQLFQSGTLLETAVFANSPNKMLEFLIDHGADLHKKCTAFSSLCSTSGLSPLAKAVERKNASAVKYLLKRGAGIDKSEAIYPALWSNDLSLLKLLLKEKYDPAYPEKMARPPTSLPLQNISGPRLE